MERITDDLESNDVSVCISRATLDDLVLYLGVPANKLVLAHNSVSLPWWFRVKVKNEPRQTPYVMVLGTREPRKNLSLVYETLARFPELLDSHRFVIVGHRGWMPEHSELPDELVPAVARGRIVFEGFVSEYDKFKLLNGADATIFPSLFEGFGLPVIEALSVGTPCIASFSSSLPEVGGEIASYFDPFSATSLRDAVRETLTRNLKNNRKFQVAAIRRAAEFSSYAGVDAVLEALSPFVDQAVTKKNGKHHKRHSIL